MAFVVEILDRRKNKWVSHTCENYYINNAGNYIVLQTRTSASRIYEKTIFFVECTHIRITKYERIADFYL